MSILEIVKYELKRQLGTDYEKDIDNDDISFAIKKAEQHFLNYTNQPRIPKEAHYVISDMALGILRINFSELFNSNVSDDTILAKLGSINVGDTSLSFGTTKLSPQEMIDKENALFFTFKAQMRPFRRMRTAQSCDYGY